jgi:SAM-dependent methyltransferase
MSTTLKKKNYLEVSYNEKKFPKTDYPKKLADYLFEKHLKKTGSIIDLGCGRGEFLESFQKIGFEVSGVDVSPGIQDLNHIFNIKQCDFENELLPFKNNSVDFVFSKSVIEHLRYPEKVIDECFRILKFGGKAIFMCPSWIHTYWGPFYIDHTHVTPFTLPSLNQLLELSGFKIISSEHFIQLPILWRYPFLKIFSGITAALPIPFRPLYNSLLPESLNKWVRFSKEKMLLVVGEKV